MTTQGEKIYLDANFLISMAIGNHRDNASAQKLLATILINGYEMYISPLCIHEMWQVIKKYEDYHKGNRKLLRRVNKSIKKIGLKFIFEERNFSYKQVLNILQTCTAKITSIKGLRIIPVESDRISSALNFIKKYDLKPADSLHLSVMEKYSISNIASGDGHFNRVDGINKMWF